ncbi:MAG TPA: serpin family protein [Terrimicrobiaceae bacterium]|nr:serpin family protein [Terrimicrobiaceae bacterium]
MIRIFAAALLLATLSLRAANPTNTAASAINNLAIDLLVQAAKPQENTALSPYSIQMALVMTYAGAEGETRRQMAKTLHYPADDPKLLDSFAALQNALSAMSERTAKIAARSKKSGGPSEPITLTMANRLFGQRGYDFRPAYLNLIKDTFGAPLEILDFVKNPGGATQQINGWIAKQTRDRIRNLIPPDALTKDTRLILANAIHLKAPWAEEFKQIATQPGPFHLEGGQSVDVPMMTRQASLGYVKRKGFVAVALPYVGDELQFLVLLPDTATGLPALESQLTPDLLSDCARLKNEEVALYLPKFRLEPPLFVLRKALEALGMENAFDVPQGSANFNGIAPRRPNDYLYISNVFHKTFVEVDEKGTEAAAATVVVMMRATAHFEQAKPIEVRVDRPFLFAIQHRSSGACLFIGRVVDPR